MSTCIACGGETRLVPNPASRFHSILFVDIDTGEPHVCMPYRHTFDGVPTSEPCSGADTCPDCIEVREECARIVADMGA